MALSPEDALRLNVLLANRPQAIRIDESSMTLYALSERGESKIRLNPNCRDELYLRRVRELLSGQVLGSPEGYPVFLRRWSRMGQARDDNLEQLLLLGEPEAVVAVTGAGGLSDELARRAWWTLEDPDNARRMLHIPAVVAGRMGPLLAKFLVEYLPFESEPAQIVESLRLALQPGLLPQEIRADLWRRGQRKPVYRLGFLASDPDGLPGVARARSLGAEQSKALEALARAGNPFASQFLRVCSSRGQAFLGTLLKIMEKPVNQEVVTLLLEVLRDYFRSLRPQGEVDLDFDALVNEARQETPPLRACIEVVPAWEAELRDLYLLSGVGYGILRPIFSKSDAVGSLMRSKLRPVFEPLKQRIASLLG